MNTFSSSASFGVGITVMFYAAALLLQRKFSWAHPLITTWLWGRRWEHPRTDSVPHAC